MGCCQSSRTDCDELQVFTIPSSTLREQIMTHRENEGFDDLSLNSPSPAFIVTKPICTNLADKPRRSLLETSFLYLPEELTAVPSSFSRTQRDSEFSRSRETKELACF